ncbi:MAG: bifunctional 5,10-methylenetetrahydrofolate dehydrogenase/5,10-methenyltetrahydrofolate cyclohydrolase [Patescibacteria group bacterium]
MQLIDGKKIAENILEECRASLSRLPAKPKIIDIVVGSDPVSLSYVKIKGRTAEKIGAEFQLVQMPASSSTAEVVEKITKFNGLPGLCGLIIQLPIPAQLNKREVLAAIDPQIDIDCLGSENSESFYDGRARFVPPTAAAILAILESVSRNLAGKKVLIVGQGELVGRPVSFMLKRMGLEVEIADQKTRDLNSLAKTADVVISGTGHPGLISGRMLKKGSVVIDAGTAESGGNIVGDVDFASVSKVAGFLTPVPGGVGPVTVAMLYKNLTDSAVKKLAKS